MWCRITEEAPGMEKRQATFYDLEKAREYFLELVKAAWPEGRSYEDTGRSIESCVEDLDFCWGDHMIYADVIE